MPPLVRAALERIIVPFSIKADTVDPKARTFDGLAATWDLDLGNDRIKRGAFKDTIKQWKSGSDAIPLLNSHDHYDIFSAIGQLVKAEETREGLETRWEVLDGPEGDAVLNRLRPSKTTGRPTIGKMSIGYEALEYSYEQDEGADSWDRIRNLTKVNLKEVSLVLFPMNPGASIDASSVKAMLMATKRADPALLTEDMRTDMRRLASRIGRLLKTAPTPGASAQESSSTSTPTSPTPSAPTESSPTVPASTPTESPSTPATPTLPSPEPTPTKTAVSDDTPVIYQFPDALQQRLTKTLLKQRVTEITTPKA